jgi:hypothetical protein
MNSEIVRLDVGRVAAAGKVLVFLNPYVSPRVRRSMLRLYVEILLSLRIFGSGWLVSFSNRTQVAVPISLLALSRIRSRGRERNGYQRKKRFIGKKETVEWDKGRSGLIGRKEAVEWEQGRKPVIGTKKKAVGWKKTFLRSVRGSGWRTILASCAASLPVWVCLPARRTGLSFACGRCGQR